MKTKLMIAAIAATLLAGPAAAQLYLGAGLGEARPDHGDTAWKAYAGMQLTPGVGGELGYVNFGSVHGSTFDAWTLAAVGTWTLDERWSLIAKLGGSRLQAPSQDENNLLIGAGAGLVLTRNFGMRLEYEDMGKVSDLAHGLDARTRILSLSGRFIF